MRVKLCAKAEAYGHEHPGVALKHRTFGVITPNAETEVGLYFRFAQVHIDACIVVIILPVLLAAQVVSQSDAHIEIAEVVFQKRIAHVRAIHHVGVIVFEPVDLEQGNRTLTSDIDEKPIGDVVAHAAYKFPWKWISARTSSFCEKARAGIAKRKDNSKLFIILLLEVLLTRCCSIALHLHQLLKYHPLSSFWFGNRRVRHQRAYLLGQCM